jgi:hypothetical protein
MNLDSSPALIAARYLIEATSVTQVRDLPFRVSELAVMRGRPRLLAGGQESGTGGIGS